MGKIFKTFFENKGRLFLFCEVLFNQGHRSRTKDHYAKFGDISKESIKHKNSKSAAISVQQQK